jgi:antitoxin PrlF
MARKVSKIIVHPDGSVVLLPKLSASAIRGIVKSRNPRPVTTEQMTAAVAQGALSRNPRRRHR